jgi:hypothetical protein
MTAIFEGQCCPGLPNFGASLAISKSVRALQIASLKLASAMENTDPLASKPPVPGELAERFLDWVNSSRLEEKTKKFYRNGCGC